MEELVYFGIDVNDSFTSSQHICPLVPLTGKMMSMADHEFDAVWHLLCFNLGCKYYKYPSLIMRATRREYAWISTQTLHQVYINNFNKPLGQQYNLVSKGKKCSICCTPDNVVISVLSILHGVLGCSGRHNKMPQTGWLKQQKCIFSPFWRLEVRNQGVRRVDSY